MAEHGSRATRWQAIRSRHRRRRIHRRATSCATSRADYPRAPVTVLDKLTYAGNPANLDGLADDARFAFVQGDICDPGGRAPARWQGFDCGGQLRRRDARRPLHRGSAASFVADRHVRASTSCSRRARELRSRASCRSPPTRSTARSFGRRLTEDCAAAAAQSRTPRARPAATGSPTPTSPPTGCRWWSRAARNNYGPYQYPEKLIPLFVTNAIEDQAAAGLRLGQEPARLDPRARPLLGAASRCSTSRRRRRARCSTSARENEKDVLAIAGRILEPLGKPKTLVRHVVDRPGHDRRYALDSSRLTRATGWQPRSPSRTGSARRCSGTATHAAWWRPHQVGRVPRLLRAHVRDEPGAEGGAGVRRLVGFAAALLVGTWILSVAPARAQVPSAAVPADDRGVLTLPRRPSPSEALGVPSGVSPPGPTRLRRAGSSRCRRGSP